MLENELFQTDRVSRRSLREFLRAKHRPVIAATIDDEIAGYALVALRKGARALRIYSLAVDARFARRGVGRALLQACEAYARRHGRSALTLEVRYDNVPAIALYESRASASSANTPIITLTGRLLCAMKSPFWPSPAPKRGTIRRRGRSTIA